MKLRLAMSPLLGTAVLLALTASNAGAVSVKDTFEKFDLIGVFAWDCSKPANGNTNWYFVNRVMDADHVQRDFMEGPTTRAWFAIIDKAAETGQGEVSTSSVRDGKRIDSIWRVEKGRMLQWSAIEDGKPNISGGRLVSSGKDMPWLNKCDGAGKP